MSTTWCVRKLFVVTFVLAETWHQPSSGAPVEQLYSTDEEGQQSYFKDIDVDLIAAYDEYEMVEKLRRIENYLLDDYTLSEIDKDGWTPVNHASKKKHKEKIEDNNFDDDDDSNKHDRHNGGQNGGRGDNGRAESESYAGSMQSINDLRKLLRTANWQGISPANQNALIHAILHNPHDVDIISRLRMCITNCIATKDPHPPHNPHHSHKDDRSASTVDPLYVLSFHDKDGSGERELTVDRNYFCHSTCMNTMLHGFGK